MLSYAWASNWMYHRIDWIICRLHRLFIDTNFLRNGYSYPYHFVLDCEAIIFSSDFMSELTAVDDSLVINFISHWIMDIFLFQWNHHWNISVGRIIYIGH